MLTLRSLKAVHFRGLPELSVRELAQSGVVEVPLPQDAGPSVIADCLRFALLGDVGSGDPIIADNAGYAYVEVGLRLPTDERVSIFRGVDRRGTLQVSLREKGGMRVTGGESDVRERLEELLGRSLTDWSAATWVPRPDVSTPPRRLLSAPSLPSVVAGGVGGQDDADRVVARLAPPRAKVTETLDGLARALRADALHLRAGREFDNLVELGGRLRRSRLDTALELDRLGADRERVRARLRRVNEYRDRVAEAGATEAARTRAAASPGNRRRRVVEWTLAAVAVVFLAGFLWVGSDAAAAFRLGKDAQSVMGLGLLVSAASFLAVAMQRQTPWGRLVVSADTLREPPAPDGPAADEWKESLRRRFSDLGDPDNPELVRDLRSRLSDLDGKMVPLHGELERLDESITVYEVESGRAGRALRRPLPSGEVGGAPLLSEDLAGAPDDLTEAESRMSAHGDAVYQVSSEREALLAGGVEEPQVALEATRKALEALADEAGEEDDRIVDWAAVTLRDAHLPDTPTDGVAVSPDGIDVAAAIGRDADALVRRAVDAARAAQMVAAEAVTTDVGTAPDDGLVRAATQGRFAGARRSGEGLGLIPADGEDLTPWTDVSESDRLRIALAVAVADGEADFPGDVPRLLVLDGDPAPLEPVEAAEAAACAVERGLQVLVRAALSG